MSHHVTPARLQSSHCSRTRCIHKLFPKPITALLKRNISLNVFGLGKECECLHTHGKTITFKPPALARLSGSSAAQYPIHRSRLLSRLTCLTLCASQRPRGLATLGDHANKKRRKAVLQAGSLSVSAHVSLALYSLFPGRVSLSLSLLCSGARGAGSLSLS